MKTAITENSELISTLITIIAGGIIRAIEKRKLRKKGLLNDNKTA
jgi:hypothetical protein